jgi:acyl-CoA reductase-like NAD-dependent aldehyde dehydrogenase
MRSNTCCDTSLFIDGTWRVNQDGRTIDVLNLVSGERLGSVAHAVLPDLRGVEAAVDKGFRIW